MPQPHFDNTVNCANARQQADAYVFLRVIWSRVPSTGRVLLFCGALPCDCYNVRVDQCGLHCGQQASARSRRRRRRRRHRRHRRRHRSQRVSGAGRHVGEHRLVGEHRRVRRLQPQQLPRRPRRQAGAQGGAHARGAQLVLSATGLAGTQHHQRRQAADRSNNAPSPPEVAVDWTAEVLRSVPVRAVAECYQQCAFATILKWLLWGQRAGDAEMTQYYS